MALVNGFLIHLVILFVWTRTVTSGFLPNVNCNTRLTVVPTTSDTSYRFYPYFVNLHRCQGSKGRNPPALMECVPAQVETVNVEVRPLQTADKSNGFLSIQGKMYLPMVNHTSCKVQCAFKREDCRKPNVYDEAGCKCVCNLGLIGPAGMICGATCTVAACAKTPKPVETGVSTSIRIVAPANAKKGVRLLKAVYTTAKTMIRQHAVASKKQDESNKIKHEAGFSFAIKSKISSKDKPRISDSDDHEEKPHETTKFRVTFKEILRRQSRVSSSLRKRSSAYSSSCPGPQTPLITSPSQDNIAEDVFFQE
eukprot:gene15263-6472_t